MKMHVKDRLQCVRTGVEDGSVSRIGDASVSSDLRRSVEHGAEEFGVLDLGDRRNMAPRDDEDMYRCLRVDVVEGDDAVVDVDLVVGIGCYAAEEAVVQMISSSVPGRRPRAGAVTCR